jgi:diadenosine tetraphosphate (Ap4A) HIT family hydrolase
LNNCPFCNLPQDRIQFENEHWVGVYDAYPVNPGHMLLITKEHLPDCSQLTYEQWSSLYYAIQLARQELVEHFPNGWNIGINEGECAGQTINHVHFHVIPRYHGDCDNPRGGVRKVKEPLVEY